MFASRAAASTFRLQQRSFPVVRISLIQNFSSSSAKMGKPVILCGQTEKIGVGVVASLKPEYDVVHFVMTPSAGATQIPAIIKGDKEVPSESELGSKDYSQTPICVILGGGYDDAGIEEMMKAAAGVKGIPWIRPDLTKPAPPLGPEYGKALVARIKELIPKLESEGQMDEHKQHYY